MGRFTCKPISNTSFKELVQTIRHGYIDAEGHKHRPNEQLATILILQGNLGCRIGDIVNLRTDNIEWDGEAWRLNLTEQKTGKHRYFIVPTPVKEFIDEWVQKRGIESGNLFSIGKIDVWKHLRSATAYLGIEKTSCHSLRKKVCLDVYEASGKDIALTSAFMNHASPATTYKYLQRSSKQMDDVISKVVTCCIE